MKTIDATHLKNRLGEVLRYAAVAPVAVLRHGRVVAYVVPPRAPETGKAAPPRGKRARAGWSRRKEERVAALCASGDFRPSRWKRAGGSSDLAGVAVMLASSRGFDRPRMLALAEALHPGMSSAHEFEKWLAGRALDPARFLPMVRARLS